MISRRSITAAALACCLATTAFIGACARGAGGLAFVVPPAQAIDDPPSPGLVAIAADARTVRLDLVLPAEDCDVALFQSKSRSTVYSGQPVATGLAARQLQLENLEPDVDLFFGLGLRVAGDPESKPYAPAGVVMSIRLKAPVYVDFAARGGDGKTPVTPLSDLARAVSAAGSNGNVWLRRGVYDVSSLELPDGITICGGFGDGFDLASRTPTTGQTILHGASRGTMLMTGRLGSPATLDGLTLEGAKLAATAIDGEDVPVQMHSLVVRNFLDRGVRLRNASKTETTLVSVANCVFQNNGGDGMSVSGAYDLQIHGARFENNVQEGLDVDDLVALGGQTASFDLSGSLFLGNVSEGLDLDLAAPGTSGSTPGSFFVRVQGCTFVGNGLDGMLIDQDHEFAPGWSADILVRDSWARANRGAGFHVDADATSTVLLHGLLASANAGDGILVTSETNAGLVPVSNSVAAGNLGAGIRASLGNKAVVASHCVLAGNFEGGIVSTRIEAGATSCVAYLQPRPWQQVRQTSNVEVTKTFPSTFLAAPVEYASVVATAGNTLNLASVHGIHPQSPVELADDGVIRFVAGTTPMSVILEDAPADFVAPGLLTVSADSISALEDYRLPSASPAKGKGMTYDNGPIVDAGPWGAPEATKPGEAMALPPVLFYPTSTSPALSDGIASRQLLSIVFSEEVDFDTVRSDYVRAVADGKPLGISLISIDNEILITPPTAGWGTRPFTIELHRGLRAASGATLSTPTTLPFTPR